MSLGEVRAFLPAWFLWAAAAAFGLIWGSFLNVVIYRVPLEMSVVRPGSHCPGCGKPIAGYDNIPVLSYVILRGRARCCGAPMSPRYPLVELMGGGLSVAIVASLVFVLPPATPIGVAAAIYCSWLALCLGLVAAVFIDLEHMFLPDTITIGGVVLGVATSWLRAGNRVTDPTPWLHSLEGAAIGFAVVWLPLIFLYKGFRGISGMGWGDAKLVALAGAWFGWPGALFVLFAGAFQGALFALALRLLGVELKLPVAVLADYEDLKKRATEGDEEAKKDLADDPIFEEEDPFILKWIYRVILRREWKLEEPAEGDDATDEEEDDPTKRGHLAFGPFLILAILELLFLREWIATHVATFLAPLLDAY